MIKCCNCGIEKSHNEFSLRTDSGRYRPDCNPCRATREAARRYGITVGDVEALKALQGNRCAICGTRAEDIPHTAFKHNPLVIDHDHETDTVRGLLCPTCNIGLGQFKDSPALLQNAIKYLSSH